MATALTDDLMPEADVRPHEMAFVEQLISLDFQGGAAAQAVHPEISAETAASASSDMLHRPRVRRYLAERLQALLAEISGEDAQSKVLQEINTLAFSRIDQVLQWDAEEVVRLRPMAEMSAADLATVSKLKVSRRSTYDRDGNQLAQETTYDVAQWPKLGALELLSRIYGMGAGGGIGGPSIVFNLNFQGDHDPTSP